MREQLLIAERVLNRPAAQDRVTAKAAAVVTPTPARTKPARGWAMKPRVPPAELAYAEDSGPSSPNCRWRVIER